MNLKRKVMVLLAAGIVALSASPLVLAATPEPAGNTQQTQQTTTVQTDQQAPATIAPAAGAIVAGAC